MFRAHCRYLYIGIRIYIFLPLVGWTNLQLLEEQDQLQVGAWRARACCAGSTPTVCVTTHDEPCYARDMEELDQGVWMSIPDDVNGGMNHDGRPRLPLRSGSGVWDCLMRHRYHRQAT